MLLRHMSPGEKSRTWWEMDRCDRSWRVRYTTFIETQFLGTQTCVRRVPNVCQYFCQGERGRHMLRLCSRMLASH